MSVTNYCVTIHVFLSLLLHSCVESQQEILIEESSQIESLHAPTGGAAELPCDVTPALMEDRVGLVIWYKQGHELPIYTFDTREGLMSHWSDPTTLGVRAFFRSESKPTVLVLSKLRPEDSGQYRCRVDFIKSPTKNTRLNLTVLIPPERLIIFNHEGHEIHNGVLGPYDESSEVNLTCVAVGGRPTARVSWWKAHALVANSEARATVQFKVERSDLGTNVTCQAVTDPMMPPMSEVLTVDVNLQTLWVRLLGEKRPLVAGKSTELVCQVVGARPKPSISWWKGGTRLKTVREVTSKDGNVTSSILTFVPSIEDAGRGLSCRAVQPTMTHSVHEDGLQMEIQHLPIATLKLGANLDATHVVEGSDVYLDCSVVANPVHHHVYFTHNGAVVKPGPRVLLANQSLVLQGVGRQSAGPYGCSARNYLGEGSSHNFNLDVKFTPTCQTTTTAMRAARGETLEIECLLDANPKEAMSYHWWFNSSAHTKHELLTTSANSPQTSPGTLLYTVSTSADYGWLQCSGSNSVGRQLQPCLFHILPADKPSSVKGCEVTNVTYESLTMNCTPGHDGGIRQSFLLQIYDSSTGQLLRNVSNDDPEFEVSGLTGSTTLSVLVQAFNKKGVSEPLTLTSSLLKYPQRHIDLVPVKVEITKVLAAVLVAGALVTALTAVSGAVLCCKTCKKRDKQNKSDKGRQDEISNIPLTGSKESESLDSLDKNPDIIPLESKLSDNCSNRSSTADYSSVRPLISNTSADRYDATPLNCNEHFAFDHHMDPCSQYLQIRPLEYGIRPHYTGAHTLRPVPNVGPSIHTLSSMSISSPNASPSEFCLPRPPCKRAYEDCIQYKRLLPLHSNGLLPDEPRGNRRYTEMYSTLPPPHGRCSHPNRNLINLAPMPELSSTSFQLEPRSVAQTPCQDPSRSCSVSPPVRFNAGTNSVYFNKGTTDRCTNTLPHMKRPQVIAPRIIDSSASKTTPKSTETNTGDS